MTRAPRPGTRAPGRVGGPRERGARPHQVAPRREGARHPRHGGLPAAPPARAAVPAQREAQRLRRGPPGRHRPPQGGRGLLPRVAPDRRAAAPGASAPGGVRGPARLGGGRPRPEARDSSPRPARDTRGTGTTQDDRVKDVRAQYLHMLERINAVQLELDGARAAFKHRYKVIWPAELPRTPVSPNPWKILPLGLLGSILLALLASVLPDVWSRRIFEAWQVERDLGLEVLSDLRAPATEVARPARSRRCGRARSSRWSGAPRESASVPSRCTARRHRPRR